MSIRSTIWDDDRIHVWRNVLNDSIYVDAWVNPDESVDESGYSSEVESFPGGGGNVRLLLPPEAVTALVEYLAKQKR